MLRKVTCKNDQTGGQKTTHKK